MRTSGCHPGADEIYERVRRRLPRISLGTVYRNLDVLAESGLIRRVDLGDGHRHYDGNLEAHSHVRCRQCGRVVDVEPAGLETIEASVSRETGFRICGHRLDFVGLCPACRKDVERGTGADPVD